MKLFENLFTEDKENVIGLTSELRGFYAYKKYKNTNKSLLLVTTSIYEANQMYQILLNYTENILFFPMDDFLTSEAVAISPEFLSYRLDALNKLINKKYIVVTNLMGYLRFLPSKTNYENSIIKIKVGDTYPMANLVNNLYQLGYKRETVINKSGQIAIRGFILDIFPLDSNHPIRIEFFDDEIEKISEFNLDTQLSFKTIKDITIYPNTEFITNLKDINIDEKQYQLPLVSDSVSLYEYMDRPDIIFNNYQDIIKNYKLILEEIEDYKKVNNLDHRIKYMYDFDDIKLKKVIYFSDFDDIINDTDYVNYNSKELENFKGPIDKIKEQLMKYINNNKTLVLCLSNKMNMRKVLDEFSNLPIVETTVDNVLENKINVVLKKIRSGFEIDQYIVVSEKELFNKKDSNYVYHNKFRMGNRIKDISKLKKGDFIVHYVHGIGIYQGIKTLNKNGLMRDYILLEYKDKDKLYVPVEKIDLISKYSSNEGAIPRLNKLGSSEWKKTKQRVKSRIEKVAIDLLKLYSEREAAIGIAFDKDTEEQIIFESQFPYHETKDQLKAISEIKKDMESKRPMDRLLCGDVGYGKTEVAFRAIFKAIMSNKQAVILCPTTILSSQHYVNAVERFKEFPVEIALLNRFVSSKKQKEILEKLSQGKIDLLIGTHRLLGKDVIFKRLGLLVVDEEQRFGVKHKEKIKEYKNNIDVLTLSATPIPRTLQMAVAGIRSLSLIETPPVNRYPVQTYVLEENNAILKDAIYKEIAREGQVFILYNNILDMEDKKKQLLKLVPDVTIATIHGRMDKNDIEKVMIDFQNKEYDVLLCTTIIETGIDIPSVNTLIVIDADCFGLSQLYQIRGRVGRSNKIAYCYLMYNKNKILSDIAKKRLTVIKDFTELGSGFAIAMRDLSIRGAGDLLGGEQSGFIDSVGVDVFLNMLNEEVEHLKGKEPKKEENALPLVEVANNISDSYVEEEDLKIEIHKQINQIDSIEKLNQLKLELEDRFGKLSEDLVIYMHEQLFEYKAKMLNINKITQTPSLITIKLPKEYNEKINGDKLFIDVLTLTRNFSFSMQLGIISITLRLNDLDKHYIYYLNDLMDIIKKDLKEGL